MKNETMTSNTIFTKKKQLALSSDKIKYSNDDSKKSWIIEQT